jgi:hypothetical protein
VTVALDAFSGDQRFDGLVLWSGGEKLQQISSFAAEVAPALRTG